MSPLSSPRIDVIGLGPAEADLLAPRTMAILSSHAERGPSNLCFRTVQHPAVADVAEQLGVPVSEFTSFDSFYETAETFADVYFEIVEQLVRFASERGAIAYAVPGSPLVLERSVQLLRERPEVDVVVHPAMSFLDVAWAALVIDPLDDGVQLVDGHRFAQEAVGGSGPFLVAHTHSRAILSDIKLAFEVPDHTEVLLLHHLGLSDQQILSVPFYEMDKSIEADHLTSLFIPRLERPLGSEFVELVEIVERLRDECPWDSAQTHVSLKRFLLEETAEVIDAIDYLDQESGDGYDEFSEELGDLMFQVLIHARIAAEAGWFEIGDVISRLSEKMIDRHPHVFGGTDVGDAHDQRSEWERAKQSKRAAVGKGSAMDDIPKGLPSTLLALKALSRASGAGWTLAMPAVGALSGGDPGGSSAVGQRLFDVVADCRSAGLDPEHELSVAARRFIEIFRGCETLAGERSCSIADLTQSDVDDVASTVDA